MKQYKYGSYKEYVKAQRKGYQKKKDRVWAREENIKAISDYLKDHGVMSGICHGVRGGQEVDWFRLHLDAQVIGTEIGDAEGNYIVQWDFNRPNEKWLSEFDFVYSNAFDHSFDPRMTLAVWLDQLKPGGVLIIETDERNEHTGDISKPVNPTDPTGLTLNELVQLMRDVSGSEVTIIDLPVITFGYRKAVAVEV